METPVTFNAMALIAAQKRAEEQAELERKKQADLLNGKRSERPYPLQGMGQDYPLGK